MNFEECCQILELTETDLGIHPRKIGNLSKEQLEKTKDLIKNHYKKLAVKHHPDKGGDNDKFTELAKAYKEATKWVEELIELKIKPQPQAQHFESTPLGENDYDWFSYIFKNASQAQPKKQNNPGDPRNWYRSYNENYSPPKKEKSYYQYSDETADREEWFNFLNENIFSHYRKTETEIEKFQQKIRSVNQNLEKEYQAEEDRIYNQAYKRYQTKKYSYYHEYNKTQYQDYVTQFAHTKAANKDKVLKIYDPLIARSNVWINLGFAFGFLGLPLLLSFFQWQNKIKLQTERQQLLQVAEQDEPLGVVEWQHAHGISQSQWEQKFGLANLEQFTKNYKTTLEGIEATNSVKILKAKLIEKKHFNQHIGEEVKDRQRSVADAEKILEYHLMNNDKPQHFSPPEPERRSYGFKM